MKPRVNPFRRKGEKQKGPREVPVGQEYAQWADGYD